MPFEIAKHAGFCSGVRRAVETAEKVADSGVPSCTCGELIHNPQVVQDLERKGVPAIHSVSEAHGRQVLIRSHGVSPDVIAQLEDAGCRVMDLTCPFVARLHQIVKEVSTKGIAVILAGEQDHPEVVGTAGWVSGKVYVVKNRREAELIPWMEEAAVVAQTTFSPFEWDNVVEALRSRVKKLTEYRTICSATFVRQQEAEELSKRSDAMIVVGGRNSANTRKLRDTCARYCPRTILVENSSEIPQAFASVSEKIGITAGASTPDGSFKEVTTHMTDIENQNPMSELLEGEANVKIYPGKIVTGSVVQIDGEAVYVNFGYKSEGMIKLADLANKEVKVGDTLEAEILRSHDKDETYIPMSQRNIISSKAWGELMEKYNNKESVDAQGKKVVKGGLIADVGGIPAFVPASQVAEHFVEKMDEFVGKDMKLEIIEVDEKKKRVVASRKAVLVKEKEAKKQEIWGKLEEGIIIHGVVRRLTDFGAFVDIGGVDGLVHVTDMSWARIKHPSDVVKPGQEVDVKILKLDRERNRIQLGMKQLKPRPWDNATEKYPVGAIVEGKVVRLTDFGAFVELEPGLDGLVHISQVALTRVEKVADAVTEGQTVSVKVLDVDPAQKRISLSIRQVLEEEAMGGDIPDVSDLDAVLVDPETVTEEA